MQLGKWFAQKRKSAKLGWKGNSQVYVLMCKLNFYFSNLGIMIYFFNSSNSLLKCFKQFIITVMIQKRNINSVWIGANIPHKRRGN